MPVVSCPECEAELKFEKPVEVGERMFCPECDIELEVISAKPVILDYAFDDEDWEEEDWEEDEDE